MRYCYDHPRKAVYNLQFIGYKIATYSDSRRKRLNLKVSWPFTQKNQQYILAKFVQDCQWITSGTCYVATNSLLALYVSLNYSLLGNEFIDLSRLPRLNFSKRQYNATVWCYFLKTRIQAASAAAKNWCLCYNSWMIVCLLFNELVIVVLL